MSEPAFAAMVRDGVLRFVRPGTRWLSTGQSGGFREADAAYNLTVPEGFDRTDLGVYVAERLAESPLAAGGEREAPTLLTGVAQRHARGARAGPVTAVATAGLTNPASLPMDPSGRTDGTDDARLVGTVNLLVGTTRALPEGSMASLVATVTEAKTATLLARTGFTGTTSDAVVVGCDPAGERAAFAGSATEVGAAARACVREALGASLDSRYADGEPAASVDGVRPRSAAVDGGREPYHVPLGELRVQPVEMLDVVLVHRDGDAGGEFAVGEQFPHEVRGVRLEGREEDADRPLGLPVDRLLADRLAERTEEHALDLHGPPFVGRGLVAGGPGHRGAKPRECFLRTAASARSIVTANGDDSRTTTTANGRECLSQ
jgi:adenosylcobinamide hydrolase